LSTDPYRAEEWTLKLLARAFVWSNTHSTRPRDPNTFAGSARYGYSVYDFGSFRIEKLSTRACDIIPDRWARWSRVKGFVVPCDVGATLFEVDCPGVLGEVVVIPRLRQVPLTEEDYNYDPLNVLHNHKLVFTGGFEVLESEFWGDLQKYRNLVSMALISHV
jgi:hypothetical protein